MSDSSSLSANAGASTLTQSRRLILTSLFTALTVIGAHLRVPLPLVPLSLQTFFVLLSGSILGPIYGAASQLLYLSLGLAGLPVFTKGGGPAYVLQPTFGYLLGFPLASLVAGALIHRRPTQAPARSALGFSKLLLYNFIATIAIFVPGVLYLWWNTNHLIGTDLPFSRAVWVGAIIFLPADLLKIFAASYLYLKLQPRLSRMQSVSADTPSSATKEASPASM